MFVVGKTNKPQKAMQAPHPTPENQEGTHPPQNSEIAPFELDPIWIENVLSKYPIHILSTTKNKTINIVQKYSDGSEERWEVSYNQKYGEARRLAYKLDTLVINRRIDEVPRPLPAVLRIGSLREICTELSLPESGGATNKVRRALLQNAFAAIVAKIKRPTPDGGEAYLEIASTRYGVVFTGKKLPDGRTADAVYILPHKFYRLIHDTAARRPLNAAYMKTLSPASQRLYELVSIRIFAAFQKGRGQARLLYSDYCARSTQERYCDYDHFKKQMYKVHRPHLRSRYLKSISFEERTDTEGRRDWMMCYAPGPRARAEYTALSRKHTTTIEAQATPARVGEPTAPPAPKRPQQRRLNLQPDVDPALLAELTKRGITERRARTIISNLKPNQQAIDQLEWGDQVLRQSPETFRNPAGFYVSLLSDNITPPETFETTRKRQLHEEAERTRNQAFLERARVEDAYAAYKAEAIDRYIADQLTPDDFSQIIQTKAAEYRRSYHTLPAETLTQMGRHGARDEIASRLSLLTFEQFCEHHKST